jgi:hypothetical protein
LLLRHLIKPHPSEAGRARGFKRLLGRPETSALIGRRRWQDPSSATTRRVDHCGKPTDDVRIRDKAIVAAIVRVVTIIA